ncbi:MAG: acyltransferase [Solirubrobacteraceae bacterium]|nr:acyltransferase [Solirubrobacteraceae bacterium]
MTVQHDDLSRPGAGPAPEPGPASSAAPMDWPRHAPAPLRGGPITLLRFATSNHLLKPRYLKALLRYARYKLVLRDRLQTDGPCFIGPGVKFEVSKGAVVSLGRWSWVGDDCKLRVHAGRLEIGAKTVVGQECTFSTYESITLGRECIVADRSMFIDFDHAVMLIESPIRQQGLYSRPVRVGHNVWVGYGACFLRGTTTGDNAIVGTYAVVTKDLPDNAVAVGAPARVVRLRDAPQRMHFPD